MLAWPQLGICSGLILALCLGVGCGIPDEPASLVGEWKVRSGFAEEFLRDSEMTDPAWRTINLPLREGSFVEDEDYRGWITVRRELPVGAVNAFWLGQDVGFFSGRVSDVARFYFNERLFGQVGSAEPYSPGFTQFYLGRVPPADVSDRNFLTIVLYASDDFPAYVGWNADMMMGPLNAVYYDFYSREILWLAIIAVYLSVAVYHLLLWRWRPTELYNLFFGLFAITVSFYWFHRAHSRQFLYGDSQLLRLKFEILLLLAAGPLLILFLSQFFRRQYDFVGLVYGAFCGFLGLAVLFPGHAGTMFILKIWQYSAIPGLFYIGFYILREFRAGRREARYMALGLLILIAAILNDLIAALGFSVNTHVARFAFFFFVVGIAILLANRYMLVHREVEELNAGLEEKVRDRTRRLENTLNEVRELKEQQDGDYFLTSLLLQPLSRNLASSKVVSVETLTRQAKQFRFRRWESEIGGDLTAADVVVLRGRRYVAVLNGDAMGKSIQGAGGALVLGTAYKSLLDRTRNQSELRRLDPELWLKQCFDELQSVFAAFDGTMLVSLVLGLVDEKSGLFYYLNAEHPFVVRYRDGKADFIERHVRFRKVGIAGLEGGILIRVFPLNPDDVLFIGSDGRDDLLLGYDETGNRIVNENEEAFLRRVEEADGDLRELERSLGRWGELMDDLSLVRVGYREDVPFAEPEVAPELDELLTAGRAKIRSGDRDGALERLEAARGLAPDQPELLKELASLYAGMERFDRALQIGRNYNNLAPGDTGWLLDLARIAAKSGDDREAVRFAERLRLREPENTDGLVLLMEAYLRLGRPDVAAKFAGRVLRQEPDHSEALRLRSTLTGTDRS